MNIASWTEVMYSAVGLVDYLMTPKYFFVVTEWRVTNLQRTDDAASRNSRMILHCLYIIQNISPPKQNVVSIMMLST